METKSGQPETNFLTVHALLSLGSAMPMFFYYIFMLRSQSSPAKSQSASAEKWLYPMPRTAMARSHLCYYERHHRSTSQFPVRLLSLLSTDTCTGLPHHQTGLLPKYMHTAVKALVNRRKRSSTIFFSHSGAKIAYSKISVCVFYHCMILYASFFLMLN